MKCKKELNKKFEIKGKNLFVSVIFNDGQIGSSALSIDNKLVILGDIENTEIGEKADLAGKKITIKSMLSNNARGTNKTNIRYKLFDGVNSFDETINHVFENENNYEILSINFYLV